MGLIDRINQFIFLWVDTLKQVLFGRAWLLLFGWFAVYWFVLYMHYDFLSPAFHGVISIWLSIISFVVGKDAVSAFSYYPQHFYYLGEVFGWAKLFLGLLFEGLILGAVARMFARRDGIEHPDGGRSLMAAWIHLVIAWLVVNGLMVAAAYLLPDWAGPLLDGPRRVAGFTFVVMPFVYTVILSLFVFAIPAVAIYGDSGWAALGRSLRIWIRRPFTAFFLAFMILVVPLMIGAFAGQPSKIIDNFRPELVYWLLAVGLFVEVFANFFWMGTTVRFLSENDY